jgi:hypothetical protein
MPLKGKENFKKLAAKGYEQVNDKIKAIYFTGLRNVIFGTPVDEGRARNNWFLSQLAPSSETTVEKSKVGSNSVAELNKLPSNVLNKKIYFSNNLPYIGVLEFGGYPNPAKKGTRNKKTGKYRIMTINGFSKKTEGKPWVRPIIIAMRNKLRAL